MKKKAIVLIIFVLLSAMFISGCTEQSTIKNSDQAGEAVSNISSEVTDVSSTLQDIDNTLGGK